MMVSLPPLVLARLRRIELEEGVPVLEQIQQAVAVWSWLSGDDERRSVGLTIMGIVTYRGR